MYVVKDPLTAIHSLILKYVLDTEVSVVNQGIKSLSQLSLYFSRGREMNK